jgi:uncharacterized protein (TIGR02246 family)
MPTVSPTGAPASVVEELIARVAEVERVQRTEDVSGMLALFDPDAVWVTGGGVRLIGLDAIAEFTRSVLPGAFADGGSVSYDVEHILVLADDLALTSVRQRYLDPTGAPAGDGLPSYVWRRTADGWRIVVGQNTGVPDA